MVISVHLRYGITLSCDVQRKRSVAVSENAIQRANFVKVVRINGMIKVLLPLAKVVNEARLSSRGDEDAWEHSDNRAR